MPPPPNSVTRTKDVAKGRERERGRLGYTSLFVNVAGDAGEGKGRGVRSKRRRKGYGEKTRKRRGKRLRVRKVWIEN